MRGCLTPRVNCRHLNNNEYLRRSLRVLAHTSGKKEAGGAGNDGPPACMGVWEGWVVQQDRRQHGSNQGEGKRC